MNLRSSRQLLAAASVLLLAGAAALLSSCSSTVRNRLPLGERFPEVRGESLSGQPWRLPAELNGRATVLIVGYVQDAQFDADRWLYGLLQARTPVRVLELPTIPSRLASWFGSRIDAGMRSGIPSEDWAAVVTLYGASAERVREFTGNEQARNVRVLLLDESGIVRWFHDRGYSAAKMLELDQSAREGNSNETGLGSHQ